MDKSNKWHKHLDAIERDVLGLVYKSNETRNALNDILNRLQVVTEDLQGQPVIDLDEEELPGQGKPESLKAFAGSLGAPCEEIAMTVDPLKRAIRKAYWVLGFLRDSGLYDDYKSEEGITDEEYDEMVAEIGKAAFTP